MLTRTLLSEDTVNGVYELSFQVSEIYNRCVLKVSEAYRATTFLFHAIDCYPQDEFVPMLIDSIPITYPDPVEGDKIPKPSVRQWVYRNCFSNFLAGAAESLIAVRLLLEIQKLASENNNIVHNKIDLDKKLDTLEVEYRLFSIPRLFREIKKGLGMEVLFLEKEILSINSVRNCIVHDNANVMEKNVKEGFTDLELHFVEKVARIEVNNQLMLLTKDIKGKQLETTGLEMEDIRKSISFPLNSKIDLTAELINAVAYTCNKFSNYLYNQFQPNF